MNDYYLNGWNWYFSLPLNRTKQVKRAVNILRSVGIDTNDAMLQIYQASREYANNMPVKEIRVAR